MILAQHHKYPRQVVFYFLPWNFSKKDSKTALDTFSKLDLSFSWKLPNSKILKFPIFFSFKPL